MSAKKKRVLLTGASGSMGGGAFRELLRRRDKLDIVLLLRPSPQNRKAFSQYDGQNGVTIVWGDLCNPDDVVKAVTGVDHVLHPAALIAPEADDKPKQCRTINFGGTTNIVAAIKKQPDNGDHIRLVYISSVAAYGDRLPPIHWISVGDPLRPSVGDYYATTKIAVGEGHHRFRHQALGHHAPDLHCHPQRAVADGPDHVPPAGEHPHRAGNR